MNIESDNLIANFPLEDKKYISKKSESTHQGSFPGRDISKTQKWYLMPPCLTLSIIKRKVGQSREWSNALPYTSV